MTDVTSHRIHALALDLGRTFTKIALDGPPTNSKEAVQIGTLDTTKYWKPVEKFEPRRSDPSLQKPQSVFTIGESTCALNFAARDCDAEESMWDNASVSELLRDAFELARVNLLRLPRDVVHISIGTLVVGLPICEIHPLSEMIYKQARGEHDLSLMSNGRQIRVVVDNVAVVPSVQGSMSLCSSDNPEKDLSNCLVLDLGAHGLDALTTLPRVQGIQCFGTYTHDLKPPNEWEPHLQTAPSFRQNLNLNVMERDAIEATRARYRHSQVLQMLYYDWLYVSFFDIASRAQPLRDFKWIVVTGGHWRTLVESLPMLSTSIQNPIIVADEPFEANAVGLLNLAKSLRIG